MNQPSMSEKEAVETLSEGFNYVCNLSRMIAMMPIEDWLEKLEFGEVGASILDPTLFKQYLHSKKPEILKKILRAALELKRTIQEVQGDVLEEMKREANEQNRFNVR